jgi:hypothetical protein
MRYHSGVFIQQVFMARILQMYEVTFSNSRRRTFYASSYGEAKKEACSLALWMNEAGLAAGVVVSSVDPVP